MCGDLQPWQKAKTVTVRLTTSSPNTTVNLPYIGERVEEIWLDEYLVTAPSVAVGYLDVKVNNLAHFPVNNDQVMGTAIALDPAATGREHVVLQRPRVLCVGQFVNVHNFQVALLSAAGATVTFTDALFVLTFVMRKDPLEIAEYRRMQAELELPSIKGVDPRTQSAKSGLF